jgi:hypothetical protein
MIQTVGTYALIFYAPLSQSQSGDGQAQVSELKANDTDQVLIGHRFQGF